MIDRYEFVGTDDEDFIKWDKGTLIEYSDYEMMRQKRDAKIAKLTEALSALEKEHRHQSECWANGEEYEGNGNALYHRQWADFAKKALEESNGLADTLGQRRDLL